MKSIIVKRLSLIVSILLYVKLSLFFLKIHSFSISYVKFVDNTYIGSRGVATASRSKTKLLQRFPIEVAMTYVILKTTHYLVSCMSYWL